MTVFCTIFINSNAQYSTVLYCTVLYNTVHVVSECSLTSVNTSQHFGISSSYHFFILNLNTQLLIFIQIFARIDQLTTDDIKATASRFLADEDHVLAAIGTIGKLPDYDWIRERSCAK